LQWRDWELNADRSAKARTTVVSQTDEPSILFPSSLSPQDLQAEKGRGLQKKRTKKEHRFNSAREYG
jgi:hypothetical protein